MGKYKYKVRNDKNVFRIYKRKPLFFGIFSVWVWCGSESSKQLAELWIEQHGDDEEEWYYD